MREKIQWIPANIPPKEDIFCFIARKRENGSIFISRDKGIYTTGLQRTASSPLYIGFLPIDVVAWLPIPEHYIENNNGWTRTDERYPEKDGEYIISTCTHEGRKNVKIAYFESKREIFYGVNDEIAWMNIPKLRGGE